METALFSLSLPAVEGVPEIWIVYQLAGDVLHVRSVVFNGSESVA